jgi:hypothetical protein
MTYVAQCICGDQSSGSGRIHDCVCVCTPLGDPPCIDATQGDTSPAVRCCRVAGQLARCGLAYRHSHRTGRPPRLRCCPAGPPGGRSDTRQRQQPGTCMEVGLIQLYIGTAQRGGVTCCIPTCR